jgi:hypothetical protein
MFIEKDERMSRAGPPRGSGWDGGPRRRVPRNWFKIVRLVLYAVVGILAGLAALAATALFLDRGAGVPTPPSAAESSPAPAGQAANLPPPEPAPTITPPPAPPAPAAPPPAVMPAPAAVPTPPPAPAVTGQPDTGTLKLLQDQIREANAALAGLRDEAARIRRDLAQAAQEHQAPSPKPPSSGAPGGTDTSWADAERTVRALAQREARPAPAAAPARSPAPPAPAPGPTTELAANALPALAPGQPRPRVFLRYPAGFPAGLQEATDIAQRLLFSDFAYADTRSTARPPARSVIRYFYPEDAPAAARLATLLGGIGSGFSVEDDTDHPGRAAHGTLEVWIGR